MALQERYQRCQDSSCTKPTLQTVCLPKGFLKRVQRLRIGCQTFHRCQVQTICLDGQHETRTNRFAFDEDRAGAADSMLATHMCPGESELLSEEVAEKKTGFDLSVESIAVDGYLDG